MPSPYTSAIIDYLGEGLAAARPATLNMLPGTLGLYYATNTAILSMWDSTGLAWIDLSTSGITVPVSIANGGTGQVTAVAGFNALATVASTAYGRSLLTAPNVGALATTIAASAPFVAIASSGSATDLSAGTVPAARMPALTGDITSGVGTVATTLATVNANVGAFGDSSHVGQFTVNAKGLITAAASIAITAASLGLAAIATSGSATDLTSGTVPSGRMPALTGDITTVAGAVATTLATVNANVGSFGSASQVATFTVNGKGLTTAAANVTITPAAIAALAVANNLSDVANVATSRTNLGAVNIAGDTMTGALISVAGAVGTPGFAVGQANTGLYQVAANQLGISVNNALAAFFDGAAHVILGAGTTVITTAVNVSAVTPTLQIVNSGSAASMLMGRATAAAGGTARINFTRARGSPGAPTIISSGDTLSSISNAGYGTSYQESSRIEAYAAAAPGTNYVPGRIGVLLCDSTGTAAPTEKFGFEMDGSFSMSGVANTVIDGSRHWVSSTAANNMIPQVADAVTAAVTFAAKFSHITSGTAAVNFGVGVQFENETGSGSAVVTGTIASSLTTATAGSEDARIDFQVMSAGALLSGASLSSGAYWRSPGNVRVSAQFDKTTSTALANITGLSVNVQAGKTYKFTATLFYTADAVGGHKYAMAGTATATAIIYHIRALSDATNVYVITSRQTALGGSAGQAGSAAGLTIIEGTITVNAAGTLTVQFAENASNGTSSILVGSNLIVTEIV